MTIKNILSKEQNAALFQILQIRFEKNMQRHKNLLWENVKIKLEKNPDKLWSLNQMEESDGEPDVVDYDQQKDEYVFFDCVAESPKTRRSIPMMQMHGNREKKINTHKIERKKNKKITRKKEERGPDEAIHQGESHQPH